MRVKNKKDDQNEEEAGSKRKTKGEEDSERKVISEN